MSGNFPDQYGISPNKSGAFPDRSGVFSRPVRNFFRTSPEPFAGWGIGVGTGSGQVRNSPDRSGILPDKPGFLCLFWNSGSGPDRDKSGVSGPVRNFCRLENRPPDRIGTSPDFSRTGPGFPPDKSGSFCRLGNHLRTGSGQIRTFFRTGPEKVRTRVPVRTFFRTGPDFLPDKSGPESGSGFLATPLLKSRNPCNSRISGPRARKSG